MFYFNTLVKLEKLNLDFQDEKSFTVTNRSFDIDSSILRE